MKPTSTHERLESLLALLPADKPAAEQTVSPEHLEGLLCAAVCLQLAAEPVHMLDIHWGEDWAEALMEQELLDEFMSWLEERWLAIRDALAPDPLRQDPDALPLAEVLDWAGGERIAGIQQLTSVPDAACQWAQGFLLGARQLNGNGATSELLEVIAALTLGGEALQRYLQDAYDQPAQLGASALIDDALFAAQDLRLLHLAQPVR